MWLRTFRNAAGALASIFMAQAIAEVAGGKSHHLLTYVAWSGATAVLAAAAVTLHRIVESGERSNEAPVSGAAMFNIGEVGTARLKGNSGRMLIADKVNVLEAENNRGPAAEADD